LLKVFILVKINILEIFEIIKISSNTIINEIAAGTFLLTSKLYKGRNTNEIIIAKKKGIRIDCNSFKTKNENPIRNKAATTFKNLFGFVSFKNV